jgi:hypothetical protein
MKQALAEEVSSAPSAEPSMDDESMAMVYVGDVYSLVAQEASTPKPAKKRAEHLQGDDSLWPLIR